MKALTNDKPFASEDEWVAVIGSKNEDASPRQTRNAKPKTGLEDAFSGPNHTPYGSFPLPILSIMHGTDVHGRKAFQKEDPKDREAFCNFMCGYAIGHVARHLLFQNERIDVMNLPYPKNPPQGFDPTNRRHRSIGAAMFKLNRSGDSINRLDRHWNKGQQLMQDNDLVEDEQARFQISLALLGSEWEFLSLRDLRVLAAVNSCLKDDWGTINLEVLSWRAVGAWNKGRLQLLGVQALGEKQVRRALDNLQRHGLIQRLLVGRTMYAAKGSMSESVFHMLAADHCYRHRAKRGIPTRNGKLRVMDRIAD